MADETSIQRLCEDLSTLAPSEGTEVMASSGQLLLSRFQVASGSMKYSISAMENFQSNHPLARTDLIPVTSSDLHRSERKTLTKMTMQHRECSEHALGGLPGRGDRRALAPMPMFVLNIRFCSWISSKTRTA